MTKNQILVGIVLGILSTIGLTSAMILILPLPEHQRLLSAVFLFPAIGVAILIQGFRSHAFAKLSKIYIGITALSCAFILFNGPLAS